MTETTTPENFQDELPAGATLQSGQFTITKFISFGGFGMTYLATDSLTRDVVIKECFPSTLCRRDGQLVQPRTRDQADMFQRTVSMFTKEAQRQAKLNSPNIAGVHQVFLENGTAYMAQEFIDGQDLLAISKDQTQVRSDNVDTWLRQTLNAVGLVHQSDILHRDISPDNILINADNQPVLIDFGAAQDQNVDRDHALTTLSIIKDFYSPQEFHVTGSPQTPSSDLYALAATFYHVITGKPPISSQVRLSELALAGKDTYVPLAGQVQGYPMNLLKSIDIAMNIAPKNRFQSAADWAEYLDTGRAIGLVADTEDRFADDQKRGLSKGLAFGGVLLALLGAGAAWYLTQTPQQDQVTAVTNTQSQQTTKDTPNSDEVQAQIDPVVAQPSQAENMPPITARWTARLPFQTIEAEQSEGTFAQVVAVSSDLPDQAADWLQSGTIIYAVNGSLVYDNPSMLTAIARGTDLTAGKTIPATFRIRRNRNAPITEHVLQVTPGYLVELGKTLAVFASRTDQQDWTTRVSRVGRNAGWDLQVSDVIVSELSMNMTFTAPNSIETLLTALAQSNSTRAFFTVSRAGVLKSVVVDFAD